MSTEHATTAADWDIDADEYGFDHTPETDPAADAASDLELMWATLAQPVDPFGLESAAISADVHADDTDIPPIVLSYPIRHGRYDGITFHTALADVDDLVAALRAVADGLEQGAVAVVANLIGKHA